MKIKFYLIFVLLIIIFIGGFVFYINKENNKPSKLDGFAQCLSDSGSKFYGTFWCPHCQNQKELFGSSKKYLPYIECSTPDGQKQNDICKQNDIKGYPTWVFEDETRLSGEIPLETLAEKTKCSLPE